MNALSSLCSGRLTGIVLAALAGLTPLTAAARNTLSPSAALNAQVTIREIRASQAGARDSLAREIDRRIKASDLALDDVAHRAGATLAPGVMADFKTAVRKVHAREQALRDSLADARVVDPRAWPDTRARLATRYEALAEAVHSAEGFTAKPRLAPAPVERPAGAASP